MKEINLALERLRGQLPEKPLWVAIVTPYGIYCAGIGNLPEDERVAAKSAALDGMGERLVGEFGLGTYQFQLIVGSNGAILEAILIEDKYLLSMQFAKEVSFSSLAVIGSILPSLLDNLREILRENPL